ncbi:MAG: dihydroorotase [Nostoc sp.]
MTDNDVDTFDREKVFIERHLIPLKQRFPNLRVVLEHITTSDAVQYVYTANTIAATITPQHLLFNRDVTVQRRLCPRYCLPILKREEHRQALLQAATSGNPKFLGTDSAPHTRTSKESSCGCAGIYFRLCTPLSCMPKHLKA